MGEWIRFRVRRGKIEKRWTNRVLEYWIKGVRVAACALKTVQVSGLKVLGSPSGFSVQRGKVWNGGVKNYRTGFSLKEIRMAPGSYEA